MVGDVLAVIFVSLLVAMLVSVILHMVLAALCSFLATKPFEEKGFLHSPFAQTVTQDVVPHLGCVSQAF